MLIIITHPRICFVLHLTWRGMIKIKQMVANDPFSRLRLYLQLHKRSKETWAQTEAIPSLSSYRYTFSSKGRSARHGSAAGGQ